MLRRQTLRNLILLITIKLKSLMKPGFRVVSVRKCSFVFVLPHDSATLAAEPFVKESTAISLDAAPLVVCSAIDRQHAHEQYVLKIEDGKPGNGKGHVVGGRICISEQLCERTEPAKSNALRCSLR